MAVKTKEDPRAETKEVKKKAVLTAGEQLNTLIGRIYLVKKTGFEILEGADAAKDIKAIQEGTKNTTDGDGPYTFYESGRPVYVAVNTGNGGYSPVTFPDPGPKEGEMGMSSMELYSLAVTLAQTIEKIIELETLPKPSLIDQAKKIMTPTIAIVACVFVIFLIVMSMA